MKHIKLFENIKSVSTIKDTINKYKEIIDFLTPGVIMRYNEIAEDPKLDYGQNITDVYGGNSYYVIHNTTRIKIIDMSIHDNKTFFTLEYLDSYSDEAEPDTFYVPFTDEELENTILKLDSKKYNI